MHKIAGIFAALAALSAPGHSQLVLNPGESWTYPFSDLPRTGSVSVFTSTPGGILDFTVDGSTFQSGDMLRYEMFENDTSAAPICSGILNSAPSGKITCESNFAWQDVQGAIRLTMLAGSLSVDGVTVKAIVPGVSLSSYDVYSSTFVPTPEPGTLGLLGAGICAGFLRRFRR